MWVHLVISRVLHLERRFVGWKAIEAQINAIPPELNEVYLEHVQRMEERSASLKLIQWICFATRPLSLDELRWAMVVDTNCPDRSLEEYRNTPDYISDNDMMKM
jgi:hypothetical protein